MKISNHFGFALALVVLLGFFSIEANAQVSSAGLFDDVLNRYNTAASGWAGIITSAASGLFWMLAAISLTWTFGMMALQKADLGEFFAELVRFTIFTGFFWWLLTNGPNFASAIYSSLKQVASEATGLNNAISPSSIVDIGFEIFYKVVDQYSLWSPLDSATGIFMSLAILIVLALVGVNMLLLLASAWILAFGGIFFLGFGGSRWTSDIAINYYKVVLGIAAQLMAMVLLVGIGKTFLDDYYSRMNNGLNLKDMGVLLIVCIILLALVNKIPSLLAGIISGASVGGSGVGQFGAGAAFGAASMAAAAAATGGSMFSAGVSNVLSGSKSTSGDTSDPRENDSANLDTVGSIWGNDKGGDTGSSYGAHSFSDDTTPYKSIRESRPDFQRAMAAQENAFRSDSQPTSSGNNGEKRNQA